MVDAPKPVVPPSPRRRLIIQVVCAVVIFLSGTVIGTGGTMQWLKSRGGVGPPRGRPGPDPNELVAKWVDEYALSAEQAEQIKEVLRRVDEKRRKLFQDTRTGMEALGQEMVAGIQAVMTPEQFERWYAEFQRRLQRMRGHGRDGRKREGRGGRPWPGHEPNRGPRPEGPPPPPPGGDDFPRPD